MTVSKVVVVSWILSCCVIIFGVKLTPFPLQAGEVSNSMAKARLNR